MRLMIFCFIFSVNAFADGKISLHVGLSPAGSFNAASSKIKGKVFKQGKIFSAKRITLQITSLKTGISLRDEHLWEHLNSKKHPRAILTELKGEEGKAQGYLEVNGVKKPIEISYSESANQVSAKFKILASSFGLPSKSYLGVGVKDEVNGEVTLSFKTK